VVAIIGFGFGIIFEVRENFAAGDLRLLFPLGANGGQGGPGFCSVRAAAATKSPSRTMVTPVMDLAAVSS